jgi:hypothetical protein
MSRIWTDIREWIAEEDAIIASGKDSLTIFDGEEGTGKSYAMLAKNVLSDPTFFKPGGWSPGWKAELDTDRVFFEEEDFMRRAVAISGLGPGKAVQLDEVDAHRRAGNTRARLGFLKFLKERRYLRLRATLGFPHVSQVDRDILRSRVRYRASQPVRGLLVVKQRRVLREINDAKGNPIPIIDWPIRGRFEVPDISGFKVTKAYDCKKKAFSERPVEADAAAEEDYVVRRINSEAAMPVIDKIRAAVLKPNAGTGKPFNGVFLDQVLDELKDPA